MAVEFVDLDKAYDTVSREMMTATMRWIKQVEGFVCLG